MSSKLLRVTNSKRILDLAIGIPALLLSLPVQVIAAVLVRSSSRGPILYRAPRVGKEGTPFAMLKFRTMRANVAGLGVTAATDPRITRVGKVLRRTKIDELPQLFHVIRGTMSLVGPRPEDPRFVALYTPEQRKVLSVRPGMTGPAVNLDEEKQLGSLEPGEVEHFYVRHIMPSKIATDLKYLSAWHWTDDLCIIRRTVLSLLPLQKVKLRTDVERH